MYKVIIFLAILGISTAGFAQTTVYQLTIDNQAVIFTFINKTCNGGSIDKPPSVLPVGKSSFEVQNDAQQGCMLRYDDGRGNILGIWIHQQQVDCSNQGGIFSYNCTFRNNELTIKK